MLLSLAHKHKHKHKENEHVCKRMLIRKWEQLRQIIGFVLCLCLCLCRGCSHLLAYVMLMLVPMFICASENRHLKIMRSRVSCEPPGRESRRVSRLCRFTLSGLVKDNTRYYWCDTIGLTVVSIIWTHLFTQERSVYKSMNWCQSFQHGTKSIWKKKWTLSITKVVCKTKPALALRQRVLKLIMVLQWKCICSNVPKNLLIICLQPLPLTPLASPLRSTVFTQRLVSGHVYHVNIASWSPFLSIRKSKYQRDIASNIK